MNREQTQAFLGLLKAWVPAQQSRSGWVVARCPLGPWRHAGGKDKTPSFGVKLEAGDAFCKCFSCGFHGKQSDLVLAMRAANRKSPIGTFPFGQALELTEIAKDQVELALDSPDIDELLFGERQAGPHQFPEWWLDPFPRWHEADAARVYLEARGVPAAVANTLGLHYDSAQRRVCFPVRDFQGCLRGLHGRAIDPGTDPRYRMYTQAGRNNPEVWLGEHWVKLDRPVVIVEGPFDLASVFRVYRNVVTPLFVNPSVDKLLRMADAFEWITLFDRGVGGDAGRAKVDAVMTDHVVQHLKPPEGCKDPGEMAIEALVEVLDNHVVFDDFLVA